MDHETLGIDAPDPFEHPAVDAGRWELARKMARIMIERELTPAQVAAWSDAHWLIIANLAPRKAKRTKPLSKRTKLIALGYLRRAAGSS